MDEEMTMTGRVPEGVGALLWALGSVVVFAAALALWWLA